MGWERLPPSGLLSTWGQSSWGPVLGWTGREVLVAGLVETITSSRQRRGSRAFDPATQEWRDLRDPPVDAALTGSAFFTGKELLVWRSYGDTGSRFLAYDPALDDWRVLPPPPIDDGVAVWVDGGIFVWGGDWGYDAWHEKTAWYDPGLDDWTALPPRSGPGGG